MVCEVAVALGLPLNKWNNDRAMADRAAQLAAADDTHTRSPSCSTDTTSARKRRRPSGRLSPAAASPRAH
eukprot:1061216-Alexandrium_andersonii.AAC.1